MLAFWTLCMITLLNTSIIFLIFLQFNLKLFSLRKLFHLFPFSSIILSLLDFLSCFLYIFSRLLYVLYLSCLLWGVSPANLQVLSSVSQVIHKNISHACLCCCSSHAAAASWHLFWLCFQVLISGPQRWMSQSHRPWHWSPPSSSLTDALWKWAGKMRSLGTISSQALNHRVSLRTTEAVSLQVVLSLATRAQYSLRKSSEIQKKIQIMT